MKRLNDDNVTTLSPSMVLQNFTLLVILRLDIPYVRWSDL